MEDDGDVICFVGLLDGLCCVSGDPVVCVDGAVFGEVSYFYSI